MAEREWEVGAVLKNKPGSQGTLLRGGSKYSSPERFPRGYTPERQAAVAPLIKGTDWRDDNPTDAKVQRRQIQDTVARSTVPAEHLQGLQWAHVEKGQAITHSDTAAGAYFKSNHNRADGMIGVKPEETRTATVIHEIGHHVSETQGTEHAKNYSYQSEHGGAEEAFADNYAEQHFRDRRGKQQEVRTYGGGKYAGHITRSDSFWDSYHQNRDSTMYKQHVETENAKYYKKYPEEEVHPDNTVDEPLISKPWTGEGETPTMHINPEAEPEKRWGHD